MNTLKNFLLPLIALFAIPLQANAANYHLEQSIFVAGKVSLFKLLEDSTNVTKDYNFSYIDSDPTVSELSIFSFLGVAGIFPQISGNGYVIRAVHKSDSSIVKNFYINIVPSSISKIVIVSGNRQSSDVNSSFTSPLVVKVADKYENPISGVDVNWNIISGNGVLSSQMSVSNSAGQAQVNLTGSSVGNITVVASISSNSSIKATFVETLNPAALAPSKLSFSSLPIKAYTNNNFSISVSIKDLSNNKVNSAANLISISFFKNRFCTIPVSGQVSGSLSINASAGEAVFNNLRYDTSEKIYIGATSNGLTSVCSKNIQFVPSNTALICDFGSHYQDGICVPNGEIYSINNGNQIFYNQNLTIQSTISEQPEFYYKDNNIKVISGVRTNFSP